MAEHGDEKTVEELAQLSMDERVQYFLRHQPPFDDVPAANPVLLAEQLARGVDLILARDAQQRAS